jgi:hypothetical protein
MPRFHPQVRRDVTTAIRHYDSISDALGDDFWAKFEQTCLHVEAHPERFHFDPSGWRRANLEKFPYHLLFYEELDGVRIMTLRRDRRNPSFGLRRK